jgi:hypothetical protein
VSGRVGSVDRAVVCACRDERQREEMGWLVELVEPEDDDDGVLPRELLLFSSRALLLTRSLRPVPDILHR